MLSNKVEDALTRAQIHANMKSGCKKVSVGCLLLCKKGGMTVEVFGANRAIPDLCKSTECMRVQKYGEDSKNHRLPSDCRSIHSEVDAITHAARLGIPTQGAIAIVTRYPCEACARALVSAGISEVYYGRQQKITDETHRILLTGGVKITWMKGWTDEDTER